MSKPAARLPENSLTETLRWVPKPLHSLYSRIFTRKFELFETQYTLPPEMFAGKRVLIAGPARTINEDLAALGARAADFDFIVKLNNGLSTPIEALGPDAWRCDILFHTFKDDARPVEAGDLQRAQVKIIVHRSASRIFYPRLEEAMAQFGALQPPIAVRLIPSKSYKELRPQLGGYRPTSGLMCIRYFLDVPLASLTIAGFTFSTTRYVEGYNDAVASDADSIKRIRKHNRHDPYREALLLQAWLDQSPDLSKKVVLGDNVKRAIQAIRETTRAA